MVNDYYAKNLKNLLYKTFNNIKDIKREIKIDNLT